MLDQILIALFVGGHCLVTGMPGTAKTLMVRTIADALGLRVPPHPVHARPDAVRHHGHRHHRRRPDTGHRKWTFVEGPIFGNILLADEINRTPPKTQSALLEAMQEHSCTVRGHLYRLPAPFFVLATQNPIELEGTYPLPEAQLDRFLFNAILDYLSAEDELKVIDRTTVNRVTEVEAVTSAEDLLDFQQLVRMVPIAETLARYVVSLVRATRPKSDNAPDFVKKYVNYGASVRAAQFIVLAAKARALSHKRYHVTYDDITSVIVPVLRHRILLNFHAESDSHRHRRNSQPPDRACAAAEGDLMQRFLDPAVLAGISSLDLLAKTVVDGFVAGLHRSPDFGFSQEFAEYRAYTPGDDLRHVDWNLFARTERCYLKRYRGETNSQLTVLLDASNSMQYTSGPPKKMDYARFIAASLFYLAIHNQRDAAGLDRLRRRSARCTSRPSTRPGQLARLFAALERAEPTRAQILPSRCSTFRNFLHRRGIAIVISDFYEDPETIMRTIEPLRFRGNEVMLFHILDPQEIRPVLKGSAILVDLETDQKIEVVPEYAKTAYRAKIDAHIEQLRSRTRARGHGLSAAGYRSTSRCGAARISGAAARRELMGFLAPWFLGGLAALGVPVFVHLLRRHVTMPRPVSSLMFFERGTQSSTRHHRLQASAPVCAALRAGSARRAGLRQSVRAPRRRQTRTAACC